MPPTPSDQPAFRRALRTLLPRDGRPADDHAEIFSGVAQEVGEPLGRLLERSLHDVRRWATTPPDRRRSVFTTERGVRRAREIQQVEVPGALSGPLRTIRDLLVRPGNMPASRVATACGTIARWAWERNHPRTSIASRVAATSALPDSSTVALELASVLIELAQWSAGEQWLDRAEALVVEGTDRAIAVRAVVARADMMVARGRFEKAAELYRVALDTDVACRRNGLRGAVHHGLCVIEARSDRLDEADAHAVRALRCFDPDHPARATVLREIAFIRLERGHFAAALPLLAMLVPALAPHPRVAGVGSLARAAGGVGDEETFEEARHTLEGCAINRWSGEAWLDVARGALLLGDPEEAAELAERAIIIAMEREEARILYLADDFLDVVEGEATAAQWRRSRLRCSDTVQSLTSNLLNSILGDPSGRSGTVE